MNSILRNLIACTMLLAFCAYAQEDVQVRSPETTIFAFDFHDVVVHRNMVDLTGEFASIIWNADNKTALFKDAFGILKDSWVLKKQYDVFDDVLDELVRRYPSLAPHADKIHDVVNAHTPSHGMIELITKLKKQGYKIYMVSNISPRALGTMRAKQPETIALFDAVYTAHQRKLHEDGVYAHEVKPHASFYRGFRDFLKDVSLSDAHKTIIFVDDKKKNVHGAIKADDNLIGLWFTGVKQLERDVRQNGIVIKKETMSETNIRGVIL